MSVAWKLKGNTTKPGNHLWDEYEQVDEQGNSLGQSSLSQITPKRISDFHKCKHKFEYEDNGNSAVCTICGYGQSIVLGIHKIKDGKVITNTPKL